MFELETHFGERLREERIRLMLTQEKLAELSGVKQLSISQYENGHSMPSTKFLFSIEKLGFDLMYLMLAIHKEQIHKDYPPEIYQRVANELTLLEMKIGENLEPAMKLKAANALLIHFSSKNNTKEKLSTSQILSKIYL